MEIYIWISSVPKKEFSPYLLTKLFSSLVCTFMRRMRENSTALQMRQSMRQTMSQYKSVRTKPRLTTQATSQSQSVVSVLVCTTAFPGRWFFPLQVLQILDTTREVCQPFLWPCLFQIFIHMDCTTNPGKMRARGCRRIQ